VPIGGGQGQDRTVDLPLFRSSITPESTYLERLQQPSSHASALLTTVFRTFHTHNKCTGVCRFVRGILVGIGRRVADLWGFCGACRRPSRLTCSKRWHPGTPTSGCWRSLSELPSVTGAAHSPGGNSVPAESGSSCLDQLRYHQAVQVICSVRRGCDWCGASTSGGVFRPDRPVAGDCEADGNGFARGVPGGSKLAAWLPRSRAQRRCRGHV